MRQQISRILGCSTHRLCLIRMALLVLGAAGLGLQAGCYERVVRAEGRSAEQRDIYDSNLDEDPLGLEGLFMPY
jgi:hypothetical protein